MGNKIIFSEEDCKKIIDMYNNGISIVNIGNVFGCSRTPIKKILNQHSITIDNVLRKIPKSEYEHVVDLYNNGKTQQEIADLYQCGKHVIYSIMKSMNVAARSNGFTSDDAKDMYKLYQNGKRLTEIADIYEIDRRTVGRIFKRNNLAVDRKTYHCNEHFFDIVDTGDKAYIVGLLWADGCNSVDRGKVTLQLQERDKKILEEISTLLQSDMPLWFLNLHDKNPNWSNTYTLTLRSKHMSSTLEHYGMVQRKSLVLTFPEWLDKSLVSHFIRGYMDGDGTIYYSQQNNTLRVSMVGTLEMLSEIKSICNNLNIKTSLYHKNASSSNVYTLSTTSNMGTYNFLQWIYNDANLKLERKYDKYQHFLHNNINNSLIN